MFSPKSNRSATSSTAPAGGFLSIPEDALHHMTSFFEFRAIGSLERTSRGLRDLIRKNTDWDVLMERDFSKFIKTYPQLNLLISSSELKGKLKYKSIVKFLTGIQKNEIQLIKNLPNKELVLEHFEILSMREYLGEENCQTIESELKRLKKYHSDQSTQERMDVFLWNEPILTSVNCAVISEAIRKLDTEPREAAEAPEQGNANAVPELEPKHLKLDNLITRLAPDMILEIRGINNLQSLSLNKCNLYACPEEIFSLTTLKKLNLQGNHLINISEEVHRLVLLEQLNIMSNKLTKLPKGLFSLPRLETLAFGNHRPSGLICSCCDLVGVRVDGNYFPELPPEITQLRTLKELNIKSIGLKKLPRGLEVLGELKWLNLTHNELNDISQEVQGLPNLRNNRIWILGNPIVKWLPLMRLKGKLNSSISVSDQWVGHYKYSNPIGQKITSVLSFNWVGKGVGWAVNNPKEAVSYVGIPLLAMFMNAQNRERLAPIYQAVIHDVKYN